MLREFVTRFVTRCLRRALAKMHPWGCHCDDCMEDAAEQRRLNKRLAAAGAFKRAVRIAREGGNHWRARMERELSDIDEEELRELNASV